MLCGFSVTEISRAFLTTEAAIAKRLTRAKQKIREAGIRFQIPTGHELAKRLDGVHAPPAAAGLRTGGLALRRPSLDDVYLRLTGASLEG